MPVPSPYISSLNYSLTARAAAPDDLPVTVAEARDYVLLGHETDRDATLRNLILTARDWIEDACRTCLVSSTVVQKFERLPCGQYHYLALAREPVRSITSITYTDADEESQTFAGSHYKLESGLNPPGVFLRGGKEWPTPSATEPWPITVTFEAGPAVGEACRGAFRDAVLLLLTFRHEFPAAVNRGGAVMPLPPAVQNVLSPSTIRGY